MTKMQPMTVPPATRAAAAPEQTAAVIKVSHSRKQLPPALYKALYRSAGTASYFRNSEEYEQLKRSAYQAQQFSR